MVFLVKPTGSSWPCFPRHAERGVAAGNDLAVLGQLFGKDARQDVEDPVGHAGVVLGADRAVLEAHFRRGGHPVGLRMFAEAAVVADHGADDADDDDDDGDGPLNQVLQEA
jgi:hypothetical protein